MAKILNFRGDYAGLEDGEVREKLELHGYNSEFYDIKQEKRGKIRFYRVFRSLRTFLMLAATVFYYLGGNALQGSLLLLLTLGFCIFEILMQEHCDAKIAELTRTSGVTVRVVRNNALVVVGSEELVQDDIIVLQGGESVPADAHILEARNVTADECAFTGSPEPVKKYPGADAKHDLKQSCVYKGSKLLSGILIARVFKTGQDVTARPEVRSVKELHKTEFESFIGKLSTLFTYAAAVVLVVTFFAKFIITSLGAVEGAESLLEVLAGIALPSISFAMCFVPPSLGLIVKIYYVNAAVRLSRKYGEIKHIRAFESLNAVTSIIIAKNIVVEDDAPVAAEYSENKMMLSRIAALSCSPRAMNAYEKSIYVSAAFKHIKINELHANKLLRGYSPPQESQYNRLHGNLWEINGNRLLCVKGEPEVVFSYCGMPPSQLSQVQQECSRLMAQGCKVFAVAFAQMQKKPVFVPEPSEPEQAAESGELNENGELIAPAVKEPIIEYEFEKIPETLAEVKYTFIGLMAFAEKIKPGIREALDEYYRAGVEVHMITPDNRETSAAVAAKAGLRESGVVCAGLSPGDPGMAEAARELLGRLKSDGEVTAALSDSFTEPRLLEEADVRVATSKYTTGREWDDGMDTMSQYTTGSACEVCNFIMENTPDKDGFIKVLGVIREARQLHRNIKRCVSVCVSAFGAVLLFGLVNIFAGGDFVLDAVFLSTLSVLLIPALAFIFTGNEIDLDSPMQASRFIASGRVSRGFLLGAAIQGGSLFLANLLFFLIFSAVGSFSPEMLRSVFASVFVPGIIAMGWVGLSYERPVYKCFDLSCFRNFSLKDGLRGNMPAFVITAGLLLFFPLMIYLPFFNEAFGLAPVNPLVFLAGLLLGMTSQLWFDFVKSRF